MAIQKILTSIGASETRTRDLLHAMQTRSQLRYGPDCGGLWRSSRLHARAFPIELVAPSGRSPYAHSVRAGEEADAVLLARPSVLGVDPLVHSSTLIKLHVRKKDKSA